jgi:hypothetical protein
LLTGLDAVSLSAMIWKRLLTDITGSVDQELLLRNEYLATENRVLKNQLKGRLRLTDPERTSLGEIGKRLGRKALEEADSAMYIRKAQRRHEA